MYFLKKNLNPIIFLKSFTINIASKFYLVAFFDVDNNKTFKLIENSTCHIAFLHVLKIVLSIYVL